MNALTTATAFSPSSFQLKFALCGRKSPSAFVHTRFPKFDRRRVNFPSLVVRSSAVNGNGLQQRSSGNSSWTNLNSTADDFSGWANAEKQSGDPETKQSSLIRILVAGAAGIVLVAGITFAAMSVSRRNASKVKEQTEPLTAEQAKSLFYEDILNEVEGERNVEEVEMPKTSSKESKTGTTDDPSFHKEYSESIENKISDVTGLRQSSEDGDASIPKAIHREYVISESLISPEATDKPHISDTAGGSLALPVIQIDKDILASEKPSEAEEEKLPNTNPLGPSEFDTDLDILVTTNPNGVSTLNQQSNLSLDPSSLEISELNAVVVSNIEQEDFVEPEIVLSTRDVEQAKGVLSMDDDGPSKSLEVSVDGDVKYSLQKNLSETLSTEVHSSVQLNHQPGNEDLQNDYISNVIQSRFDSISPGDGFTSAGIPAPSVVFAALQAPPGKVLVPAVVDQLQSQAFSALQVLKVIEDDVQPGDLCTRREYARWLVIASSTLFRNTTSKVYPAMFIENVSELAFDDIAPEDPDFPCIQGLAEAGLIASKLSRRDMQLNNDEDLSPIYFSPESPLSRQDLVSWKMALEKRQLPVVDKKALQQLCGFIDIEKINPDAWPAIVADLAAGEQGITTLAFGYTRLFQPEKPVTKAQAAIALSTGDAFAIVSEELERIEAESIAENAVAAHNALVAQVEKDLNSTYLKELSLEREKISAIEKLAEEAKREVDRLRAAREEENLSLMKARAAVDSEMEVLSKLRLEVEEQLQTLMTDKVEISYEKERLNKLRTDAETENQEISRLQYELEVERKALSMARAWAEDEAKRAREQAKALDEARDRWERQGIKVMVDNDLREEAEAEGTWLGVGKQTSVEETIERSENLVDTLKKMADEVRGKCKETINKIIEKIVVLVSNLRKKAGELKDGAKSRMESTLQGVQHNSAVLTSSVKEGAKRVAGDWKEGVDRLSQKFKT